MIKRSWVAILLRSPPTTLAAPADLSLFPPLCIIGDGRSRAFSSPALAQTPRHQHFRSVITLSYGRVAAATSARSSPS